jgi:nucleotide-binding universal stress UspA family protein
VSVVNVMPEPGVSSRIEPPSEERHRQQHLLDEARRFLAGSRIETRTVAPVGDTAREILAAAERIGADLIIVAPRARRSRPSGRADR